MSDIKVGDLVVVAKPCPDCGDLDALGMIFRVYELFNTSEATNCCGSGSGVWTTCATDPRDDINGFDLRLLKKIPPLEELEGEKREEKEPA